MRFLGCIIALLLAVWPASAERRVALVIGNANYEKLAPLGNPVVDAERMASILQANGFDVLSCDGDRPGCYDLDRGDMTNVLEDFEEAADGADAALVFYAGHGMETSDGNVLAPVNMELSCETLDPKRALLLDTVIEAIEGAREKIVIVDACRNDPLQTQQCAQRGAKSLSFNAIAVPESGAQFLLMSSTKPGDVAQDGLPGTHSPFARVLFRVMEEEAGIRFDQMLHKVTKLVIEETTAAKFTQVPEMLIRGAVPETCLRGGGCSTDPEAVMLKREVEALQARNARSQEYEGIVLAMLHSAGYDSLDALPPEQRDAFFNGIFAATRALGERSDGAGERALVALRSGDESAAERLFEEEAAARDAGMAEEMRKAAESYRHLAAIAWPKDVAKAAKHFKTATERDPNDIQTWLDLAATSTAAGNTVQALRAYDQASALARTGGSHSQRIWAAFGQGDIVMAQGQLGRALQFYRDGKDAADERARAEPDNAEAQRDLAVSQNRIGDILVAQGDIEGALAAYQAGLVTAEQLAADDPGHTTWQRDLSLSHTKIGDMKVAKGDLAGALAAYRLSRDIRERIAAADATSPDIQRDLFIAYERIGNVRNAQGDLTGAAESYQAGIEIVERLAATDPGNIEWQRDLSVANERIGDIKVNQGDLLAALEQYQMSLDRIIPLRDADPLNTDLQRFTSVTHEKIGDVMLARGDVNGALESFEKSIAIREKLIAADPTNVQWQRDLAVSNERMGDIKVGQGDLKGALAQYQMSLDRIVPFRDSDPSNMDLLRFTSVSHDKIGDVKAAEGDLTGALDAFQTSQAIRERLLAADPSNLKWQRDMAISNERIGDIKRAQGDLDGAIEEYQKALNRMIPFRDRDPSNAELQRFTSVEYERIGDVRSEKGDRAGALGDFRAAFVIRERLAAADPNNAGWQWDLYTILWRMGDHAEDGAAYFEKALATIETMNANGQLSPSNVEWIERTREKVEAARQ